MKKLLISMLIFFFVLPGSLSAEEISTEEQINEFVELSLQKYQIPGASLAVFTNGEEFYNNWGTMSDGKEVTADTPFLIGSLSKPITALAIMMLVEKGEINLDEPIDTYLSEFTYQSKSSKKITVSELLKQTSGISPFDGLKVTDKADSENTIFQAVEELSGVKLTTEPGEEYAYNSANYLLLGAIIENVTNQTYAEFITESIFTPLGMTQSAADYDNTLTKGLVSGYRSWMGKPIPGKLYFDNAGAPYGYLVSSSTDLMTFLKLMLRGGEIISNESLTLISTPPDEGRYGYGWHFSNTDSFPYHGGATRDYRSEMYFNPDQDVAAVLLTNKYHSLEDAQVTYIMNGIQSILNGDEPDPLPDQSFATQWTLIITIITFLLLTVIHFIMLKRRKRQLVFYIIGICSVVLGACVIPIYVGILDTPWKTIRLFAPDIALLTYIIIGILTFNGLMAFGYGVIKKKG
ncbi:CubicO group peptidase, beta-lactamase class C family [Gracilibacillus orientalis]|uniref:CubicO group peptidase, beta-lactamase class C family n=1 Tax=Gracilibacillus orientalis TaxID=334253 RepID=A0A1I4P0H0_9BACI|nr:serine hydrolase domain-containing protein [Gracilibacillus orientalis]SFM21248.1 CubicO group peptidase, beta-lactamase class C family [Gracilibacillus orientalis]